MIKELAVAPEWFIPFEQALNTRHPASSNIPATVIGFGEISAVLEFDDEPDLAGLVLKRLPIFHTLDESTSFEVICREYVRLLTDEIGIDVPTTFFFSVPVRPDLVVLYAAQEKLPGRLLGHRLLHWASDDEILIFLELMLRETSKIWAFNNEHEGETQITLDLQLSNWALASKDPDIDRVTPGARLNYVDINTPLFRVNGQEQLNPKQMLRGSPGFLRWVLERYMAADVINRYYDARKGLIDVVANCIKEGREDIIPAMVDVVNRFFEERPMGLSLDPIRVEEIYRYYRQDAFIWITYLSMRKLDRFIKTRLARSPYDFILPDRIARNFPLRNRPPAAPRPEKAA